MADYLDMPSHPASATADPEACALLASAALFAGVPAGARTALLRSAERRRLAPGEQLLAAGADNTSLFLVLDGALDVLLPGADAALIRIGPGECAGELSLIDGQPTSADVVAAGPTSVMVVGHDEVWSTIDRCGAFARNLLRVLARRVRHDNAVIAESTGERRHFEDLSMRDGLTGLHNRRWFDMTFPGSVLRMQEHGETGALLMVDADRFKRLNDEHGHGAGDDTLRRLAAALESSLRPTDQVVRYGGEEFAVLVAGATEADAMAVAERLRRHAAATTLPDMPSCTVSVGVAIIRADEAFDSLVRRADAALFRAKNAGRDRVCL